MHRFLRRSMVLPILVGAVLGYGCQTGERSEAPQWVQPDRLVSREPSSGSRSTMTPTKLPTGSAAPRRYQSTNPSGATASEDARSADGFFPAGRDVSHVGHHGIDRYRNWRSKRA